MDSAHTALKAEHSKLGAKGTQVECAHVAGYLGNPVAEVLDAASYRGVCVLVAAVECEPTLRRNFEVDRDSAALNLAEVLALEQNRRGIGSQGQGDDGAIDLSVEIADANRAPMPLRGDSSFPSRSAFAEQR